MVEIGEEDAETCIETIETLIEHLFVDPAKHYFETLDLNKRLAATGRKEIDVPVRPSWIPETDPGLAENDQDTGPASVPDQ